MAKRRTHEEFVEDVESLTNSHYTVLGLFTKMKDQIKIRHNLCGLEYSVTPDKFLGRGNRCPTCSRKKSHMDFSLDVQGLVGDEYKPIGTYQDSKTKITMLHNVCGNTWEVTPNQFLSGGTRCPTCCYSSKKRSHTEFVMLVREQEGDNYSVLSEDKGSRNHVRMRHNVCGNEYAVNAHSFLQGRRCKKCFDLRRTKTHGEFLQQVRSVWGDEFNVLETYKGNTEKVRVQHMPCKYEFLVRPYSITSQKTGCPQCAGHFKRTPEDFIGIVRELVGDEYEVVGKYINALIHIELYHNVCETIYLVTPAGFLSGKRCSFCYGNKKKNTDGFKEEVRCRAGDEYEVLSEYITSAHPITMLHLVCGYI